MVFRQKGALYVRLVVPNDRIICICTTFSRIHMCTRVVCVCVCTKRRQEKHPPKLDSQFCFGGVHKMYD